MTPQQPLHGLVHVSVRHVLPSAVLGCAVLYGTVPDDCFQVEKGGMDEAFVDVTKEAKLRVAQGACAGSWRGHLHLGKVGEKQTCKVMLHFGAYITGLLPCHLVCQLAALLSIKRGVEVSPHTESWLRCAWVQRVADGARGRQPSQADGPAGARAAGGHASGTGRRGAA